MSNGTSAVERLGKRDPQIAATPAIVRARGGTLPAPPIGAHASNTAPVNEDGRPGTAHGDALREFKVEVSRIGPVELCSVDMGPQTNHANRAMTAAIPMRLLSEPFRGSTFLECGTSVRSEEDPGAGKHTDRRCDAVRPRIGGIRRLRQEHRGGRRERTECVILGIGHVID